MTAHKIAASVYRATGSALAPAAVVTRIPRSNTAWPTCPRTDPAACRTARSRVACRRTSRSSGGHPHDVMSTSAAPSRARAGGELSPVTASGSPSVAAAASRASSAWPNWVRSEFAPMTSSVSGRGGGLCEGGSGIPLSQPAAMGYRQQPREQGD
ncbi:MAG TPA: hypothetical protein VGG83_03295 [Trebonia sp.]